MAGRDGRGPAGMGPMTGRGFGPCGDGYFSPSSRFGRRSGYGAGFGRRYGHSGSCLYEPYPMDEGLEKNLIEKEKIILEARLKNINDMLDELEDED